MNGNEPISEPLVYGRIAAHSKRQAMDWSLVLASQDIHPIIKAPEDSSAWSLLVEAGEYERALGAIRQYRLENRGWAWRRELPGSVLEVHAGALFWCLLLAFWHWFATFGVEALNPAGRMDSVRVPHGEWWRLFTAVTLHADLAHLMANATFGVVILGFAMARFGPGLTLLATYLCGALGNLTGLLIYSHPYTGVGSSGMMMGALGLLCVHSFGLWRQSPKAARYVLSGVSAGLLLFVLFGVNPRSDILAHLGGFAGGLLFGSGLALVPQQNLEKPSVTFAALGILVLLLILTWSLALSR